MTDRSSDQAPPAAEEPVDECAVVLARMYEFIDNELETADGDNIRRHLADCEPCLDRFDVEQAVKTLVSRSCGGDRAPDHLRAQVLMRLTVAQRQSRLQD